MCSQLLSLAHIGINVSLSYAIDNIVIDLLSLSFPNEHVKIPHTMSCRVVISYVDLRTDDLDLL